VNRFYWRIVYLDEFLDAFEEADAFYQKFFSDELDRKSASGKLFRQYENEDDALNLFLNRLKTLRKSDPLTLSRARDFNGNVLPQNYREISVSPWVGYYLLDQTVSPPICGGVLFGRKDDLSKLMKNKNTSFEEILKAHEPRIRT